MTDTCDSISQTMAAKMISDSCGISVTTILYAMSAYVIYLLGVLHCFQHCTGHITMGSFVGRGNHYIQLVKIM